MTAEKVIVSPEIVAYIQTCPYCNQKFSIYYWVELHDDSVVIGPDEKNWSCLQVDKSGFCPHCGKSLK
jgi:hypothetical protein